MEDPFISRGHVVKPEWIDAYDHMNMARYVALFDDVTYELLDGIGLGLEATRKTREGLRMRTGVGRSGALRIGAARATAAPTRSTPGSSEPLR